MVEEDKNGFIEGDFKSHESKDGSWIANTKASDREFDEIISMIILDNIQ